MPTEISLLFASAIFFVSQLPDQVLRLQACSHTPLCIGNSLLTVLIILIQSVESILFLISVACSLYGRVNTLSFYKFRIYVVTDLHYSGPTFHTCKSSLSNAEITESLCRFLRRFLILLYDDRVLPVFEDSPIPLLASKELIPTPVRLTLSEYGNSSHDITYCDHSPMLSSTMIQPQRYLARLLQL